MSEVETVANTKRLEGSFYDESHKRKISMFQKNVNTLVSEEIETRLLDNRSHNQALERWLSS